MLRWWNRWRAKRAEDKLAAARLETQKWKAMRQENLSRPFRELQERREARKQEQR